MGTDRLAEQKNMVELLFYANFSWDLATDRTSWNAVSRQSN